MVNTELPFTKFAIAAALVFSVGCKRGPITKPGLIVTISIPFSFHEFPGSILS